jgi:hypothetical protein
MGFASPTHPGHNVPERAKKVPTNSTGGDTVKVVKILGVLVLLVVVGVGGLVFYGLQNIDSFIKHAVEKYGSEAVGTQVSLNEVKVDLGQGRIELLGLEVANPPGYNTPYAFALNQIAVQVQPGSLTGSPIIVDEITIDNPSINAEERNLTQTNLSELAANVNSKSGDSAPAEPSAEAAELPNIAVSAFNFSRANISLVSEQYGDRTIEMPSFTAKNLGGSTGLPPEQLAVALLDEVLDQATAAVKRATGDAAKSEVRDRAKEAIDEKLSDEDKKKLEDVKSLFNR